MKNYQNALDKNGPYVVGFYDKSSNSIIQFIRVNNYVVACKLLKEQHDYGNKQYQVYYIPVTWWDKHKQQWYASFPKGQLGFGNGVSRKSIKELMIPLLKKK